MTTDRVFVLLMMVLLMMAGCFEATSTTEAEEEQDSTSGNDGTDVTDSETTSNQNSNSDNNHAPVISAEIISSPAFYNGNDCTSTGIEFKVRHAMMDWDGTIISAGWDINLDGQIDFPVTANEGYTDIQIAFADMIENIVINPSTWGNNPDQHYYERSIVFGAQDDDGQWSSSELFEISKLFGYIQDNTFSYASGYDFEQCDDFEDLTDYDFSITDHADYVNSGSGDYLINIERINGQNGIDLSRIIVIIELYGNSSNHVEDYRNWNGGCGIVNEGTCEMIIQNTNSNTTQNELFDTNEILEIRAGSNVYYDGQNINNISVSILIDNILVHNEYVSIS